MAFWYNANVFVFNQRLKVAIIIVILYSDISKWMLLKLKKSVNLLVHDVQ